jgi:DMSO/TMAO reductase YedYZ molybdopterin-dependent catalytic subunit
MTIQPRLPSPMRPQRHVDQSVLAEHSDLVASIERRALLRGSLSLGALTMLTGCDITNRDSVQSVLSRMSLWNAYIGRDAIPEVDGERWRVELAGLISDKRPRTLREINAMPQVTQRTRHICVEGWDYIGEWSGVPFRPFLENVGADLTAKYVGFKCADGYTGSIDMPSALHPQTQLTTKYAGETIDKFFGYPIRLKAPTKLGFKQPKQIVAIEVTNTNPGGYWENRGFNWFSGL